jgi:anti-anti-sigma factor
MTQPLRVNTLPAADGRVLITLAGDVDVTTAPLFKAALDEVLSSGTDDVEIDFTDVTFMDSSGLGAVIHAHRAATGQGRTLSLGARSPVVDHLLDVSGVERAFSKPPAS